MKTEDNVLHNEMNNTRVVFYQQSKKVFTSSDRVDSPASSPHFFILSHSVNKQLDSRRFEVHVSIQSKNEGVVCDRLLSPGVEGLCNKLITQKVIHVHDLKMKR